MVCFGGVLVIRKFGDLIMGGSSAGYGRIMGEARLGDRGRGGVLAEEVSNDEVQASDLDF